MKETDYLKGIGSFFPPAELQRLIDTQNTDETSGQRWQRQSEVRVAFRQVLAGQINS